MSRLLQELLRRLAGPWRTGAVLLAFALGVRALYLAQIADVSYFDVSPRAFDEFNFYSGAKALAQGNPWAPAGDDPKAFLERNPEKPSGNEMYSALYKYALGALWWLAGYREPVADEHGMFFLARSVHLLFGAVASLLLYTETRRYATERAGVIASLLYSVCGPLIFHESMLSREYPATWLTLAALWALGRLERDARLGNVLIASGILSLAYQCRTNAVLFVPFALGFLWWKGLAALPPIRRLGWIAAGGALFWALCLPLMMRNARVLPVTNPPPAGTERNAFTVSAQGPFEVAMGNHPDLTAPGYRPPKEAIEYMEKGPLTATGMVVKVLSWAAADPLEFGRLYLRKIYWFFSDYEVPDNHSFYIWRHFSPLLALPTAHAALYGALAVVGAAWAWTDRRRLALPYLFLAAASLSVVLTYVVSRFRVQALPFWILFAAIAADRWLSAIRERRIGISAVAFLATASLAGAFSLPEPEWIVQALGISERHFPEKLDGTVVLDGLDRERLKELSYAPAPLNRGSLDHENWCSVCFFQADRAFNATPPDVDEAERRLAEAARALRIAWARAESLGMPQIAPRGSQAEYFRLRYRAAALRNDPAALAAVEDRLLRLQFDAAPAQFSAGRRALHAARSREDLERAARRLRCAAMLDPAQNGPWAYLAQAELARGDLAAARYAASRLRAVDPAHPAVGEIEKALVEAGEKLPRPDRMLAGVLEREGEEAERSRDPAKAVARYASATARDFTRKGAHAKMAALLIERDPAEALRRYEAALLVDPADAESHFQCSRLVAREDPMRAVWHLQRVLALAPDRPEKDRIARAIELLPLRYRPD